VPSQRPAPRARRWSARTSTSRARSSTRAQWIWSPTPTRPARRPCSRRARGPALTPARAPLGGTRGARGTRQGERLCAVRCFCGAVCYEQAMVCHAMQPTPPTYSVLGWRQARSCWRACPVTKATVCGRRYPGDQRVGAGHHRGVPGTRYPGRRGRRVRRHRQRVPLVRAPRALGPTLGVPQHAFALLARTSRSCAGIPVAQGARAWSCCRCQHTCMLRPAHVRCRAGTGPAAA